MPSPLADGPAGGGLGFLVLGLAVDDGGDVGPGVLPHTFPDAHHVAARGIDDLAAALLDARKGGHVGPKGGDDDDVAFAKEVERGLAGGVHQVANAQGPDLLVDLGVVDDLPQNVEPPGGENFGRRVGEVDGPFHAVTKAELLGQLHGDAACGNGAAAGAQAVDDGAPIVRFHLGLHLGHDFRGPQVHPPGGRVGGWLGRGHKETTLRANGPPRQRKARGVNTGALLCFFLGSADQKPQMA